MRRKFTLVVIFVYGSTLLYVFSRVYQQAPEAFSHINWEHFAHMFKGAGKDLSTRMGPIAFWGFFGGIASLILLAFLSALVQRRKGAIKFSFPQKNYRPLDTIQGHIQIFAKQKIACHRVTLTLRCVNHSSGSRQSNGNHVAYKNTQVLLGEMDIPAGTSRQLSFSVQIPAKVNSAFEQIGKHLKATGTMGQLAQSFISVASHFEEMSAQWELVAEVEAEGVDLDAVRKIEVSR